MLNNFNSLELRSSFHCKEDVLQSIDSLEVNCLDLEERVKELLLADAQSDCDIPNDVASTEALLNEHAVSEMNR